MDGVPKVVITPPARVYLSGGESLLMKCCENDECTSNSAKWVLSEASTPRFVLSPNKVELTINAPTAVDLELANCTLGADVVRPTATFVKGMLLCTLSLDSTIFIYIF